VSFNEKFITGRLRRRLLRPPAIEGWLCDEQQTSPPERAQLPLEKLADEALGLRAPRGQDLAKLSAEAAAAFEDGDGWEVTVGWPEALVIVRRAGVILYAEGDPVHFGELPLDHVHSIRRSGYEYLDADTPEVKVELAMDTGDQVETVLLGPGESASHGPYRIFHERSFDPSDRKSSLRQHGYFMRIRRAAPPNPEPPSPLLHPLDVETAAQVVEMARRAGRLDDDEAMLAEPKVLARRLQLYEGAAAQLEQALRASGPWPATFARRGESVTVETPRVARGDRGETIIGRATLVLHPTRALRVSRIDLDSLPGRMRRAGSSGG